LDNNKNTLNNDNLATIESGNSAQRPTNENTENKKTIRTNKYKNLNNSEIKEEDEYNNSFTSISKSMNKNISNRNSFDKNSKNCSRREIPFSQDINQQFTFNNKIFEFNEKNKLKEINENKKNNKYIYNNSNNVEKQIIEDNEYKYNENENIFSHKTRNDFKKESSRSTRKEESKNYSDSEYSNSDRKGKTNNINIYKQSTEKNKEEDKYNSFKMNNKNDKNKIPFNAKNNNNVIKEDKFKRKLNERLKNIRSKQKAASVDNKYKKSDLIGEKAKLLQEKIFKNKDIDNNSYIISERRKLTEDSNDVNDIINSKPASSHKKKKSKIVFNEDYK